MATTELEELLTSTVKVLKDNGVTYEDIAANVQRDMIMIIRSDVLIESGDLIQHPMSNGGVDTYEVLDPNFYEAIEELPAHYQLDVKKLGVPEAKAAVQSVTTIHMSGHNSRVNQNSTDNSVNVVQMSPELQEHVNALREEVNSSNLSDGDTASANQIIDSVESHLKGEQQPSGAVVNALLSALPNVGSIASIAGLIIAALGG